MLYSHFTEKLLGIKGVMIKNIEDNEEKTEIYLEKSVKPHICPECGKSTSKVHDYRNQRIKDIPRSVRKQCSYCINDVINASVGNAFMKR